MTEIWSYISDKWTKCLDEKKTSDDRKETIVPATKKSL